MCTSSPCCAAGSWRPRALSRCVGRRRWTLRSGKWGVPGSGLSKLPSRPAASLQAYLWDNNQMVVQWLEQHWQVGDGLRSTISDNIKYLQRDSVLKTIRG